MHTGVPKHAHASFQSMGHCKPSFRAKTHSLRSNLQGRGLKGDKEKNKIRLPTQVLEKRMMEKGLEVSGHKATTLPSCRGPIPS